MDNLSHSVVGLAVGELIHRSLPPEDDAGRQRIRRRLLLIAGWAASNFPDLDLFLTPLLPAPLGYLLHHRGHTHTLLYAIPQAVLLWAALWLWPSARRLMKDSANARGGVIAATVLGLTLHMLMDFLNSYGIHPFHPFDSRWLFGDMVFILEPYFWIAFGVPLAMMVRNRFVKLILLALLAGVPAYFTAQGYLPRGSLGALALVGLAIGIVQQGAGVHGRQALIVALCLSIGFIGMQGIASSQARMTVFETLQRNDPASRVLDAAMTSFPTNPLCWNFVSVQIKEDAGTYTLRRGMVSVAPDIMPVTACPSRFSTIPLQADAGPAIAFLSVEHDSLAALRRLKRENCHFEAWMRFARAPLLDGDKASDMRFGWRPGDNFTDIHPGDFRGRECSRFIPGWDFPRADLLFPQVPHEEN